MVITDDRCEKRSIALPGALGRRVWGRCLVGKAHGYSCRPTAFASTFQVAVIQSLKWLVSNVSKEYWAIYVGFILVHPDTPPPACVSRLRAHRAVSCWMSGLTGRAARYDVRSARGLCGSSDLQQHRMPGTVHAVQYRRATHSV